MKISYEAFENYKRSRAFEEPDLDWLANRLTDEDLDDLKKQIEYLMLEVEEETLVSLLEYVS